SVSEGAGTLNLTVTRSGGLPAETVYATTLQDQGYSNNSDYTGFINQNVVFGVNQTQATVAVSIINDSVVENNESFSLIVQRNASDPNSTYLAKDVFTIVDDDTLAVPAAPTGLVARPNGAGEIFVDWTGVSGAEDYMLFRGLSATDPGTQIYHDQASEY